MANDRHLDRWNDEQVARRKGEPKSRLERTGSSVCPVCLASLQRRGDPPRSTRTFRRRCEECGAGLAAELTCGSCGTQRVWRGKLGMFCHGCGTQYEPSA